ncbi:hypothetical protein Q1695_006094 [Nippostrongylus brasiliensis]|nr:hypothetical protein Q1695_006094 [Nippostrongylus brasiliensis]
MKGWRVSVVWLGQLRKALALGCLHVALVCDDDETRPHGDSRSLASGLIMHGITNGHKSMLCNDCGGGWTVEILPLIYDIELCQRVIILEV